MSHIALFLPSLRGGGAERVMVHLANGLAARGHLVDLLLVRATGPYLAEVSPAVRLVDFDKSRMIAALLPLASYLRRERPEALLSALRHANVTALWARGLARLTTRLLPPRLGRVSFAAGALNDAPHGAGANVRASAGASVGASVGASLGSCAGASPVDNGGARVGSRVGSRVGPSAERGAGPAVAEGAGVGSLARAPRLPTRVVVSERCSLTVLRTVRRGALLRRLMRWVYPAADGVIGVSQGIAAQLVDEIGLDPARVTAIANPVDLALIHGQLGGDAPHLWLADPAVPVVLAVGRLEGQKSYPLLLEAFARLSAARPARLIILGEGGQRGALEAKLRALGLEDLVALPGFQPNPYLWMARARVYVLSSRSEGFPNALVQAMACGAAVVSTDCPTGPAEILEGGRWGRLVPVGDAAALSAALAAALDETGTAAGRAEAKGRGALAVERYGVQSVLDQYQAFLLQGQR